MGQPVVHFEVIGKDGERLQRYYSELFGWQIDADNPMGYGMVAPRREHERGRCWNRRRRRARTRGL